MNEINLQARFNPEVDYGKSDKPFVVCRFITECSKLYHYYFYIWVVEIDHFFFFSPPVNKLSAKVTTHATALCLFHKYNATDPHPSYDPYVSVTSCNHFAASKCLQ